MYQLDLCCAGIIKLKYISDSYKTMTFLFRLFIKTQNSDKKTKMLVTSYIGNEFFN